MWGHILTEASTQQNFNFGFSTYKSEILVHLSQWQYWWWFWFSIWWAVYYFIILRTMTKRTFNYNVTLNTSIRGRGKWGDFLVALIPLSWCANILINSNFILRMIEWQNESSLFTIRVQGKQWYWVYKYDPNTAQAVISTPKNIGHNRWRFYSGNESYNADTYYQAIHLAAHLEFQDSYSNLTKKVDTHRKNLNTMVLANEKILIPTSWSTTLATQHPLNVSNIDTIDTFYDLYPPFELKDSAKLNLTYDTALIMPLDVTLDNESIKMKKLNSIPELPTTSNLTMFELYYHNTDEFINTLYNQFTLDMESSYYNAYYDFIQLDETSDADGNSRHLQTTQPFRLIKGVINQHVVDILQHPKFTEMRLQKPLFLTTKFYQSGETIHEKELMPETLWGFRQKKYKRLKKFKFKPEVIYDPVTFEVIGEKTLPISSKIDIAGLSVQNIFIDSSIKAEPLDISFKERQKIRNDSFSYRISSRIARHRSELVPVTLARRLLRTKRTLVLPAHVNLTVITNSYDVVHSWFIPGLGLKLDCVPGRSTHHTFYIDNIGFYYGQCAEICGRYHHHMPIRLCALPFHQFVVWWQAKGLARLNRNSAISENRFLNSKFETPITREKLSYTIN